MSKETTMINIRYACLDMAHYANGFNSAMQIQYRNTVAHPERIPDIADYCIKYCNNLITEIRKQRRKLVRARYELRKEQENEKNAGESV